MLFRSAAALVSVIALVQSAVAALTPAQVVTNINIVATVSGDLNNLLVAFTTNPSPQAAQAMGQTTVTDFQTIITDLGNDVTAMDATPPFYDAGAAIVVPALDNFVLIHQQLLATVIGKHGVFAQFGVTAPIAAILRSLEASIDSFAFALIAMIPTRTPTVQAGQAGLDESVKNTINLYEQICIPSPLYPTLQPICVSL